jgi:hypothetical protein
MTIRIIILSFIWAFVSFASPEAVERPKIPYEKRALEYSLRCLETIRGDEERIASTRNWVAENIAYFGDHHLGISVLRGTTPHYRVPSGCADSAIVALGNNDREAVHLFLELGLDVLPYASGRGAELVQFQILRVATVTEDAQVVQRAWDAETITHSDLRPAYNAFVQDWRPAWWDRILDLMFPSRSWQELKKDSTREVELAWKAERAVDFYTAMIFLKEAQARVGSNKSYPSHWLRFVEAGIRTPAINTRPAGLSVEMARLALLEGQMKTALKYVEQTWELVSSWGPNMSGVYKIERDLALTLAQIPDAADRFNVCSERLLKRAKILCDHLDPYEQLLQLPLLAEGLQSLGKTEGAKDLWLKSANLCALNQNPESQSIGLTRLWTSFARANVWPEKETEKLLLTIEKKLPEAYSKVHF